MHWFINYVIDILEDDIIRQACQSGLFVDEEKLHSQQFHSDGNKNLPGLTRHHDRAK